MKRKISSIVAVALMMISIIALAGCGSDKQTEDFIASVQKGVEKRWEYSGQRFDSFETYRNNVIKGIEEELACVSEYADQEFENQELKKVVSDYVTSLENEKEGMKYYADDAEKYNELYVDKGHSVRVKCMQSFVNKYGLNVSSENKENLQSLLQSNTIKMVVANEQISLETEFGEVVVTIEDVVKSDEWTEYAMGSAIQDSQYVAILKTVIENKSFNDGYNPGFVSMDFFLNLTDASYTTISPLSVAWEYGGYESVAGSFLEVREGQKKKVAVGYGMDNNAKEVIVYLFDKDNNGYMFMTTIQ